MSLLRLLVTVCFLALPSLAATFGSVTPVLGVSDLVLDEPRGRLYLINSNLSRVDVYTEQHVAQLSPAAQGLVGIVNAKNIWRMKLRTN